MTSSAPSSSATWPPSKPPSTTPRPPAPTPGRPSTSSASPGTPPAWTGCWKSARPSSHTPSWAAYSTSMTGSTTGSPPSTHSSVKRRDLAGQLGQRINPESRHPASLRVIALDHGPRAALYQRSPQPEPRRGQNVIVEPITHIHDLLRLARNRFDHLPEKPRFRLRDTP